MRLLIILLFVATIGVSARPKAQTITLSVKDFPLEKIFSAVKKQTGYVVFYNQGMLKHAKPVSLSVSAMPLEEFLTVALKEQPFRFSFAGKSIYLSERRLSERKSSSEKENPILLSPFIAITGHITNEEGQPLAGASVNIKGSEKGVATDEKGFFSIDCKKGDVLVITFLGYQSKEIKIENATTLSIVLLHSDSKLDEVVIVGYGTTSKRMLTSGISKLDGAALESKPINTVSEGLKGRVAGLRVYNTDNQPGLEAKFRIRGGSSINNGNDPLILIDGVEGDLTNINPNDIESIEILKDASSAAIYGSRASNGVVLVTTKKGKPGKTSILFESSFGRETFAQRYNLMNGEDFIKTMRPAVAVGASPASNFGATAAGVGNNENSIFSTRYLLEGESVPEGYKSMKDPLNPEKTIIFQDNNFYDRLVRPELWQNYYLRAAGGRDRVKYNFSLGYKDDDGIVKSTGYSLFTMHGNVNYQINDFMSFEGGYDMSEMKLIDLPSNKRNFFQRTLAIPNTEKIFWPDGIPVNGTNSTTLPPDWYYYYYSRNRLINRYSAYGALTVRLYDGLKVVLKGTKFDRFNRFDGFVKETNYGDARSATADISHFRKTNGQAFMNFNRTFDHSHHLDMVLGTEVNKDVTNVLSVSGQGGASDLTPTVSAQPILLSGGSGITQESLFSYFGRINYSFNKKYILSANFRADASSKFASQNRWGYFPSVSAGWIISDEPFMESLKGVNFLKLKGSIGKTGNNSIGLFDAVGTYNAGAKYGGTSALYADVMGNENLRWETTTQTDIGLEAEILNSAISFNLDFYNKITNGLILNMTLPNTSGFKSVLINSGSVKFYGLDFDFHTSNIKRKNFSWTTDFTYSYNMNRILKLPDNGLPKNRMNGLAVGDGTFFGGYAEGERLGGIWGFVVQYIIEDEEQLSHAYYDNRSRGFRFEDGKYIPGRKAIGDYEWKNREGSSLRPDGSIQIDDEDQFLLGYTIPTSTGGIGNTFTYKGLSLNIFLDYQLGSSIQNTEYMRFFMGTFGYSYNLHEDVKKTWKEPGDNTRFAKFFANDPDQGNGNYSRNSNIFTQSADYLCLRDVSLTYSFPKPLVNRYKLQNLSVYFRGGNLFYFTETEGVSPENAVADNYATDFSPYPSIRRYVLGLKVEF